MPSVGTRVDSRYLVHSERFFFNSTISVPSIMNRIYLCIVGLIFLYCDTSIYESLNTYVGIYMASFSGFHTCGGVFDTIEYIFYGYILYILISHSTEYIVKLFGSLGFLNLSVSFGKNLGIYIVILFNSIRKDSPLQLAYIVLTVVIASMLIMCALFYIFVVLFNHTDFIIISKFYINSLTHSLCEQGHCLNDIMHRLNMSSFFKYHYGVDYFTIYDYSNNLKVVKYYYLFKFRYVFLYSIILLCVCSYIWVQISVSDNYQKLSIFFTSGHVVYTLSKFLCIRGRVFVFLNIFGLFTVCMLGIIFSISVVGHFNVLFENIIYFRMNCVDWFCSGGIGNWLLEIYRLLWIKFHTILGEEVDNSRYFWTGTACIFHMSHSHLSNAFLSEITSSTYVHKSSMFCIGYGGGPSLFSAVESCLGISGWTTSVGVDAKLFSNYMVKNSYQVEVKGIVRYVPHPFFVNGRYSRFLLLDGFNWISRVNPYAYDIYIYNIGSLDKVCSYIEGLSCKHTKQYYLYARKIINYNMVSPSVHLFDYSCYYNSYLSTVRYSYR